MRRSSSATVTGSTGSPRLCSANAASKIDAVRGLVEVARLDVRLDRGGDRLAAEHHRPEQRLLGLEVVRRDAAAAARRRDAAA